MSMRFLIALTLAALPFAQAHKEGGPGGIPKNYCEDPSEWYQHDFSTGTGVAIFLGQDGNLVDDCNGDTVPADYDGHLEFAFGGAFLSAESGDGVTSGSIVCLGEAAHHPAFGPFLIYDIVLNNTGAFFVAADAENLVPPTDPTGPDCGDFETDLGSDCVALCSVTFPPGLDGVYTVYVGEFSGGSIGTGGHITTGGAFGGPEAGGEQEPGYASPNQGEGRQTARVHEVDPAPAP